MSDSLPPPAVHVGDFVLALAKESARRAVLLRSEGHCESPHCTSEPQDITDAGHPILQVDHVQDLAKGGPDHPE